MTFEDLRALIDRPPGPSVSLFMPTRKQGKAAADENRIRFKTLLGEARSLLAAAGDPRWERKQDIDGFLEPARTYVDDHGFWARQERGFALFVGSAFSRAFRLPRPLEPSVAVLRHFRIVPLLPARSDAERFYVLCVYLDRIRLYSATRTALDEVELEHTPGRIESVIGAEVDERHLQWHTGTPRRVGDRAAAFHGQGEGVDDEEKELRTYYAMVAGSLVSELHEPDAPVVLVGLPHVVSLYRDADRRTNLCETMVRKNPDALAPDELHAEAWTVVEPTFDAPRRAALDAFRSMSDTERTSVDPEVVVPASWDGRVDTLLVASGRRLWGTFDPETRRVSFSEGPDPDCDDLVDLAAARTLARGGSVFVIGGEELPGSAPVGAVYRY